MNDSGTFVFSIQSTKDLTRARTFSARSRSASSFDCSATALTEEEKRLLTAFRKLVPNMRAYMLANVEMLAAQNG